MRDDEDTPVGKATCRSCDEHTNLYITEQGLRCNSCRTNEVTSGRPTYTPSLRDWEDTRGQEMAENADKFIESLADIGFDVELQDGSTYEMDKMDAHAVMMKYGDEWEKFLSALARKVAEHFEKETEPTKFTEYAPWGSSGHDDSQSHYETHAELAPIVAYSDLRSAKMQLGLMALSDPDEESPSVIGLGDNEIHQYTENGRITIEYTNTEDDDT